jgi:protein-disulfide isomerase
MGLLLPASRAQSRAGTIDDRISALEAEVKSLRDELRQLRAGTPGVAREPAALPITGDATRGSRHAKLVLVELSDYQCPFCGRYAKNTYPLIDQNYVRSGRLQYVFKNFPLEEIHPRALKAAQAAECAGRQGKYWPMHDRLFASQESLDEEGLVRDAMALGITMSAFMECLDGETESHVRKDVEEGRLAGADATPTFFLGTRQPDGTLKILRKLTGAMPYDSFKAALDEALKNSKS